VRRFQLQKPRSEPRPVPRRSPVMNLVRPLLLAAAVLLLYGGQERSLTRWTITAVVIGVAALLAVVAHTAFSRGKESRRQIRCG